MLVKRKSKHKNVFIQSNFYWVDITCQALGIWQQAKWAKPNSFIVASLVCSVYYMPDIVLNT